MIDHAPQGSSREAWLELRRSCNLKWNDGSPVDVGEHATATEIEEIAIKCSILRKVNVNGQA